MEPGVAGVLTALMGDDMVKPGGFEGLDNESKKAERDRLRATEDLLAGG